MDSRSMLKVFTIAFCFVYCSADINKEEHVVKDNLTPATAGGSLDKISDLDSTLFSTLNKTNETIISPPAPLTDFESFEKEQDKDKSIFGGAEITNATKAFVDTVKSIGTELNKINKKNSGGKIGDGILIMVIPLFIIIFESH